MLTHGTRGKEMRKLVGPTSFKGGVAHVHYLGINSETLQKPGTLAQSAGLKAPGQSRSICIAQHVVTGCIGRGMSVHLSGIELLAGVVPL